MSAGGCDGRVWVDFGIVAEAEKNLRPEIMTPGAAGAGIEERAQNADARGWALSPAFNPQPKTHVQKANVRHPRTRAGKNYTRATRPSSIPPVSELH